MKGKLNKELMIFIFLIPIFLMGASFFSNRSDQLPSYSTLNRGERGYSVYYETLKQLGYPVQRGLIRLENQEINKFQIVVEYGDFDINHKDIREWVEEGGRLLYLTQDHRSIVEYGNKVIIDDDIFYISYEKGMIIVGDADGITNASLLVDTSYPYQLLQMLVTYATDEIIFNEYHLFNEGNNNSLWNQIPLNFKMIIYQLILVVIGFFYYKGKSFGKPIPLHDEVEREEHEYLYASASLYRGAKCWDIMLENYYENFLKILGKHEENWLELWGQTQLPHYHKAKEVYSFMEQEENQVKVSGKEKYKETQYSEKEYKRMVELIDQLTMVLKKRRENFGK
ncbi:DUF4350 domain-containing protein [Alkaliphilus transvaalensis]|uniref:DUF4350 domain-containing protein n=1 Tax=Alkaliphilus transvaalensis TaxID=114628 RepID=UPI00047D28C0|nr:DUF4350 domain-containing protein [Alkaliphilus transvaalensis]